MDAESQDRIEAKTGEPESAPARMVRPRKSAFRRLRGLAPIVLGVLGLAYLGISTLAAHMLTKPSNRADAFDARRVCEDIEPWSTRTADGLTLRGWYCRADEHRRLIVLVHGMGGSWQGMAAIGQALHWKGYDVLLFDLRGHGRSDPARLSMGRREREDIRAVINWAESYGYTPERIGWLAQSLGASTLLMEAARNPEIQVAVLDSPFADLPDLLDKQLPLHSHLPSWFNPGILFVAHRAFGIRTDDILPVRDAPAWGSRPVLLIHGDADSVVPVRHAHALADAIGPACEELVLPGVEHVGGFNYNQRGYISKVDRFFKSHLAQ